MDLKTILWQVSGSYRFHGADKGNKQIPLPKGVFFKSHFVTYCRS